MDPRRFVSVDECGTHTSMTRAGARAPRGERAYGKVPRNRGKNTTPIASMTLEGGMGEAMAVEGATDAAAFEAYVERFLAPSLSAGRIVLLDNLGAHKTGRARELIEERGCELRFLPAYSSPDLNPIEEAFSKIKALLKKAAARTREALMEALSEALAAVTRTRTRGAGSLTLATDHGIDVYEYRCRSTLPPAGLLAASTRTPPSGLSRPKVY